MTTLLREVIRIPETVHQGDFVLKLADGVAHSDTTVHDYVVTPDLRKQFERAVDLVSSAMAENSSKATYLDGSFGSGKSHFMAVLHALLAGERSARSDPGLSAVVSKADRTLSGKTFLQVPYHLLGAESLSAGILGGYLDHVRSLHPEAPLPAILSDAPLLESARQMRARMGDAAFFGMLTTSDATGDGSGWGDLDSWEATSFEAALDAPPGSEDRETLVAALLAALPAFGEYAAGSGAYVDLDRGLEAISRHAAGLGYDGLVLYLDELVLLFMNRMADLAWVSREAPLLGKLVEAAHRDRPAPIISFVSRQRDLRTLVGADVTGQAYDSFAQSLTWQEGRFGTLPLSDRNLPLVASKRVLTPVDEAARVRIDTAFARTDTMPADMRDTLLSGHDRDAFRLTYPFSPAVMDVLVDLSEVLQRERTALRVMRQILVEGRDTLQLGQLIPLADLFDVLVSQSDPMAGAMSSRWETAQKVYAELRRLSLEHFGLTDEEASSHAGFAQDDMVAKTLVIASLLRNVPATRDLTARKVVALNYGWIRSPIPQGEASMVLTTVRRWAARTGKVSLTGDDANPVIGIRLDAVDVDGILSQAAPADSPTTRRAKLRDLLFRAIGADAEPGMDRAVTHQVRWRGTPRMVELVYGNTRDSGDLGDGLFRPSGDAWRFVLDYPFDEPGFTPADDLQRLGTLRAAHPSRTVAWVPRHLSAQMLEHLGRLVKAEHALGPAFGALTSHLPENDRLVAQQQLRGIRDQLTSQLEQALKQAYGVANATDAVVDTQHQGVEMLVSLDPSFQPRVPSGASLQAAFEDLVDQALRHDFPAHPEFDGDVESSDLRKVLTVVRSAIESPDHRVVVPGTERAVMRRIANPLRLGTMAEQAFTLGDHWANHLEREISRSGRNPDAPVWVEEVRGWLDTPQTMGLPAAVADLVVVVFAEQTNRGIAGGATVDYDPRRPLSPEASLVPQPLPSEQDWARARSRAAALLGVRAASELRTVRTVREFAAGLRSAASAKRQATARLVDVLERRTPLVLRGAMTQDEVARLRTARAAQQLVAGLADTADDVALVGTLAALALPTTDEAVGRSIGTAEAVTAALGADWTVLEQVAGWPRERDSTATAVHELLDTLAQVWQVDELTASLPEPFESTRVQVTRLVVPPAPEPPVTPPPAPPVLPDRGSRTVDAASAVELGAQVGQLATRVGKAVEVTWRVVE